jgi:hypothetical protein
MTRSTKSLFLLELNEINFKFVEKYAELGKLPTFKMFIDQHGYAETTSESHYDELEPWIQWVTAHTGKSLAEHGVFRLGDIVNQDILQIWERLEDSGLKVGAVSPMNAKQRMKEPAFFIPDPWTKTEVAAPPAIKRMYQAIAQIVNENAQSKLRLKSAFNLIWGAVLTADARNYPEYIKILFKVRTRPWLRAAFLDLLLADVFSWFVGRTQPNFASLFLNAGAHIQHHYMFSSECYEGELRNPSWYAPKGVDPLLDIYKIYDRVLAQMLRRFPDTRIMLATGLHQDPYPTLKYYWRLKDHAAFLQMLDVSFVSVEPRMSRDFVVACTDTTAALAAARKLELARDKDGLALFEVDNRGADLFVMLTYPKDITEDTTVFVGNEKIQGFREAVAFVALKNGEHNGTGYFSDSDAQRSIPNFPLKLLPDHIIKAFEV